MRLSVIFSVDLEASQGVLKPEGYILCIHTRVPGH